MGIYIFSKEIIKSLFKENPAAIDFGKEIIPIALKEGKKIAGYQYQGYWEDIGTIRSYFESNLALADDLPSFDLFNSQSIIYTRPRMLAPSKIFGTNVNQSVIAEGCILRAKAIHHCLIGIRTRIGEGTMIKDCIVFGNDSYQSLREIEKAQANNEILKGIGNNCHIERAIIDKEVFIGNNVVIRGHESLEDATEEKYVIRDGIIVLKKGVHIADGTVIGAPV